MLKSSSWWCTNFQTNNKCNATFSQLLRVLDMQHNLLVNLPETLANCRSLAELKLTANRLTDLPSSIGGLNSLRVLELGENQMEQLPQEVIKCNSLATSSDTIDSTFSTYNAENSSHKHCCNQTQLVQFIDKVCKTESSYISLFRLASCLVWGFWISMATSFGICQCHCKDADSW